MTESTDSNLFQGAPGTRYVPTAQDHERAMASLLATLDLTDLGESDTGTRLFEGPSQEQPSGRAFGGQVLGQALMAVTRTVDEARPVHSMHAYFLRPTDANEPLTFSVELLRDGRSFSARRVHALQKGRPVLSLAASFQIPPDDDRDIEHQTEMPEVPDPESLPSFVETMAHVDHPVARFLAQSRPFDLRAIHGSVIMEPDPEQRPVNAVWMKPMGSLPDDLRFHAGVLAYASDYTLLEPVLRGHGLAWSMSLKIASLDHAMWFHQHARVDEWLLYVQSSPFAGGGRGLGCGQIFTRDGTLVASVAQEGMVRLARDYDPSRGATFER